MAQWERIETLPEFASAFVTEATYTADPNNPYATPSSWAQPGAQVMPVPGYYQPELNQEEVNRLCSQARDNIHQLRLLDCLSAACGTLFSAHFWPIVGTGIIFMLLMAVAGATYTSIVIGGPISSGFALYLLKTIRNQPRSLGDIFQPFSTSFLATFLVALVGGLLAMLGTLCLIIPGIYLYCAYMLASIIAVDYRISFWNALELSRKVISARWFAFTGVGLLAALLTYLGVLVLCVGIVFTFPIAFLYVVHVYERTVGACRAQPEQFPITY
jgi:hypothetical protein